MQGENKDKNNYAEDGNESEALVFDNFSITNATLSAGINLDDTMSMPNATLAAGINFEDNFSITNATMGAGIPFDDTMSMPNATLAAGINFDDNYNVDKIQKTVDYYNRMINDSLHKSNNIGISRLPPNNSHDSIMDQISRSQPLYGGSNLLAQYSKYHQNSSSNETKGKQPANGNFEKNQSWNANPISQQASMFKAAFSMSSMPSTRPNGSQIFDPNTNVIPAFRGHRRHSNIRRFNTRPRSLNRPSARTQLAMSFEPIRRTQEPENIDPGMEAETEEEEDSIMIKARHHRKPSNAASGTSAASSNKSDAIEIKTPKGKKYAHSRRKSTATYNGENDLPPPSGSFYGSYASSKFGSYMNTPISSSVLAKTSSFIPDASLPLLVKTIDSHLVNTEAIEDNDPVEDHDTVYNLKGGDVARDIYNFNEKIKRNILTKRSKSEPNLYELNKKKESDFNISEISIPGGFRREFMRSRAKKQGKTPPNWITSNFIDFLALYGHYAGDDDFDEDYYSEGYYTDDMWDEDEEDEEDESEFDLHKSKYEKDNYFDEKIKIFETQSSYEVLKEEDKNKITIEIEDMSEKTPLLNNSNSLSTSVKRKKKHKRSQSSSQTGTATEGKTLFLLLKAFVGTGILFLPKAFSNGGMLFSLVLLLVSGWLTYFTMILLIKCSEKFGGSYGDIGKQLFGKPFKVMIQASIAITQSGFCCAYIIFILQSVKSIISTISNGSLVIPDWLIIIVQVLIYIPLSWIRKIQNFSITSLIADVFILIGLTYIIISEVFILSSDGPSNDFSLFNKDKFPLFLGTAIFAFEGIGLIIPLQRSMREPEKFPKVLKKSMYIISAAMFVVGGLSYFLFGDKVHTIIFMDVFPDSVVGTFVRSLYTLAIVFSFPLTCYSGLHIIEPLFIPKRRPFKSFSLRGKKSKYSAIDQGNSSSNSLLSPESALRNNNSLTQSSSYSSLSKRDTGKNSQIIKWMKNIFRAVFVSCIGLIAFFGSSNLDNFVSIIGSFACIPLMFIYPALMHYRGVANKFSEKAADISIIIFGFIATVWITKLSLDQWQ